MRPYVLVELAEGDVVLNDTSIGELGALGQAGGKAHQNVVVAQIFTDIDGGTHQGRLHRRELGEKGGLVFFGVVDDGGAGLGDDLGARVSLQILDVHIGADVRAEGAVINLMRIVVLEPLENVAPPSVHCGFNGGGDNKGDLLRFHQLEDSF